MTTSSLIVPQYRALARYNARFNRQLFELASELTEDERRRDLGAFFGSLHGTLDHILLGDRIWLGRFARSGHDFPALEEADLVYEVQSMSQPVAAEFERLYDERIATDQVIMAWVEDLTDEILASTFRYKNTKGVEREHPMWIAVTHLFNHQTHHRGQATTLFKQLGRDPGVTDFLVFALS
jgi:uncharacterized damage-inducible protein DinB